MDVEVSGASHRRPEDTASDKEMVKGGSIRGRRVVEDGGWDATRIGNFANIGEYIFALRPRPVGVTMAKKLRQRRRDHSEVCG